MKIKHLSKKLFREYRKWSWNRAYDAEHNRKEEKLYQSLIAQDRTRMITSSQERLIQAYAMDVFGSLDFAPGLRSYTSYSREFKEGWIPNNYFGRIVLLAVNDKFSMLSKLRTHAKRLLQTDLLPDLVYCIEGNYTLPDGSQVFAGDLEKLLFSENEYVFLKTNSSKRGQGILKLDRLKFKTLDLRTFGDFVIQKALTQHPFLEEIITGSIASLRITTVKKPGLVAKNRLTSLRVGRAGDEYIHDATTLVIGVSATGNFSENALGDNWKIYPAHPDTGVVFKNLKLPFFEEAQRVCEELHDRLGLMGIIGWDACITPNGTIQLMEWNAQYPGINYSEALVGPNFKGLGWENLVK